jgi:hypothetical protein
MISETSGTDRSARWHLCLVLGLMAASLLPIWVAPRFPSQNGPWYLLLVHMMSELGSPEWNFAEFYQVNWHPVPHSLNELLMLVLSGAMPLLIAEKVALTLYAVAVPLSVFYFLGSVAPSWKFMGYFSFLAVHNYVFYRGYQDFSLSIPLFFFAFALWHRYRNHARLPQWIALALLSAAIYLAHLLTFLLLASAIGFYRLIETRDLRKAIASGLAATWLGWILVGDYVLLVRDHSSGFTAADTGYLAPHTALENIAFKMFMSISSGAYVVAVLPWLWVAYIVGRRVWEAVRTPGGSGKLILDPLVALTAILTAAYFAIPYKLAGWHYVNVRIIPFILLFSLACGGAAPPAALNRIRTILVASVAVAAVTVYGLLAVQVVRMNQEIDDYLSGIPHFVPNSRLLPVHLENEAFGQVRPLTRAHEHYHIAKGGVNGYSVARYDHLTFLWYRTPPDRLFPRFNPRAPEESLRQISLSYDYVLVWGRDEVWPARLAATGFEMVHRQGKLQLFRNKRPLLVAAEKAS